MDDQAIAAAIAARFTGLAPPAGENDVALVSPNWPDQIGATPAILVDPNPDDSYAWFNFTRHGRSLWRVRFLREQSGTQADRLNALAKWRPVLRDRLVGQLQLGLSYIDNAELSGMGPAVEISYAESTYDGLEMTITVDSREQVAAAA